MPTPTTSHRELSLAAIAVLEDQGKTTFTLKEFNTVATPFFSLFSVNRNLSATLRYELQTLRDQGRIKFVNNRGLYSIR